MGQILIISQSFEPATNVVLGELSAMGAAWVRINTDNLGDRVRMQWRIGLESAAPAVELHAFGQASNLDSVSAVWYRRHTEPQLPATLSHNEEAFVRREIRHFWSGLLSAFEDKPWVNDWRANRVTKLEQLRAAQHVGLSVPPTLISNDPDAVREFVRRYGPRVIVKPVSYGVVGNVYEVELSGEQKRSRGPLGFCFTQSLCEEDFLDDTSMTTCPITVQAFIPKAQELRVTVVGDQLFSVAILTAGVEDADVDWRRLGSEITDVPHVEHPLPAAVAGQVHNLMRILNLRFGCLDLILTPDGEYVFLEVNTQGQWGWTEAATGLPITRTLAELLCTLARSSDRR